MTDAELAGLLREHALLEGDFVSALGPPLELLPGQVPLRDETRSPEGARRADRHACARVGPGCAASRRARARRRRARGVGFARRKPPLPHRPQGGEGVRDRAAHRRASSRRAKRSVSSRTWSRAGAPRSRRSRPSGRPGSSAGQRSAWSIGRREGPTRSPAKRCASCRFLRPRTSCRAEKTRKPAWLRAIRRCC